MKHVPDATLPHVFLSATLALISLSGCALLDTGNNPVRPEARWDPLDLGVETDIALSPDGSHVYIAGSERVAYDVDGTPRDPTPEYRPVSVYPVNGFVYGTFIGGDDPVALWTDDGAFVERLTLHPGRFIAASADGSAIVVCGETGPPIEPEHWWVSLLDIGVSDASGPGTDPVARVLYDAGRLGPVALSPDGSSLIVADVSLGQLVVVNVADGTARALETLKGERVQAISWPPGGGPLVATTRDLSDFPLPEATHLIDVVQDSAELIVDRTQETFPVGASRRSVARTLDGKHLLSGSNRSVYVLDIETGAAKWVGDVQETVAAVALNPAGDRFFLLTSRVHVYDVDKLIAAEPLSPYYDLGPER